MAILFVLNMGIMLVIGKFYPRSEAYIAQETKRRRYHAMEICVSFRSLYYGIGLEYLFYFLRNLIFLIDALSIIIKKYNSGARLLTSIVPSALIDPDCICLLCASKI